MKVGLIIFIILSFSSVSFAQSRPLGVYRIDIDESEKLMANDIKQKYDSLRIEERDKARLSMKSRDFQFEENGLIQVRWSSNGTERLEKGTWTIVNSNDVPELRININGIETIFQVNNIDSQSLVLINNTGRGLFNALYLRKISQ